MRRDLKIIFLSCPGADQFARPRLRWRAFSRRRVPYDVDLAVVLFD
jgi:hypothetical protein